MVSMRLTQFLQSIALQGLTVDDVWSELTAVERASLTCDWCEFWSRPDQVIPDGDWWTHGFLAGRGWGKTVANVGWIVAGIMADRIGMMNLIGPTEEDAWAVGYEDPFGGLLAWSPPWFRPTATKTKIVWPNGATCRVYGSHKPGKIRGGGLNVVWCTELQTWPANTAIQAWDNAVIKTREGACKILWDATSGHANELIDDRVRDAMANPKDHILVRGRTKDNTLLGEDYIRKTYLAYTVRDDEGKLVFGEDGEPKLTERGDEELNAKYSLDSPGALWKAVDIRHHDAGDLSRCVVSIDPAFSAESKSDETGVCVAGLDMMGRAAVLDDQTGKWEWDAWGDLAIDLYLLHRCDCLLVERNKGGDAVAANVRARVEVRNHLHPGNPIRVEVIERGKRGAPPHDPRVIRVREVVANDPKYDRGKPVAGLYKAGLAYHVKVFRKLERIQTSWEPGPGSRSPNALDAMVQAVHELKDLGADQQNAGSCDGLDRVAEVMRGGSGVLPVDDIARMIVGSGDGWRL